MPIFPELKIRKGIEREKNYLNKKKKKLNNSYKHLYINKQKQCNIKKKR